MGKTHFFISCKREKRVQSRHLGLTAKMKEGIKKKKMPLFGSPSVGFWFLPLALGIRARKSTSLQKHLPADTTPQSTPKHSGTASLGLHITSNSSHYDGKEGAGTTEECRSQRALTTQAFDLDHTSSHSQPTSHTGSTVGNATSASGPHQLFIQGLLTK